MMEDPVLVNTPNGGGLHEASDTGTQNRGSDVFTGKPERIYRVVVELLITNLRLPKKDDQASVGMANSNETSTDGQESSIVEVLDDNKSSKAEAQPLEAEIDRNETQASESNTEAISQYTKDQPHIVFVDPVGTRWMFPYEDTKTWNVSCAQSPCPHSLLTVSRVSGNWSNQFLPNYTSPSGS